MKIFIIIPTFNRLECLKNLLLDIDRQKCNNVKLVKIVIDDCSTDGTSQYLDNCCDIISHRTKGNRWWPGAINDSIKFISENMKVTNDDYILLLNDDTRLPDSYINNVLHVAKHNPKACVGSMIHDAETGHLISVGALYDDSRLKIFDAIEVYGSNIHKTIEISLLSGRGSLFPAIEFLRYGLSNEFFTPQYYADYLISNRFKKRGHYLLVDPSIYVLSDTDFGNMKKFSFLRKYFWKRSANYVVARIFFDIFTMNRLLVIAYPMIIFTKFLRKVTKVII